MVVKNQLLGSHLWLAEDFSDSLKAGEDQHPNTAYNLNPTDQAATA